MAKGDYKFLNASDYFVKSWGRGKIFQDLAIKKTMLLLKRNIMKYGVQIYFKNQWIHLNKFQKSDLNFKCGFCEFNNSRIHGDFNSQNRKISLNTLLRHKNYGAFAFSSICHEGLHLIQMAAVRNIDAYPKDSYEYQYLSLIKHEIMCENFEIGAFGFNFSGKLYVNEITSNKCWPEGSKLPKAFYALQPCERAALVTGRDAYEYIVANDNAYSEIISDSNDAEANRQLEAINILRERYNAFGLSYDALCNIYDTAKMHIFNQTSPESGNDILAAMMYDLVVMLKFQAEVLDYKQASFSNINDLKSQCSDLLSTPKREKALNTFYSKDNKIFVVPGSIERDCGYLFSNKLFSGQDVTVDMLRSLTIEEQRENPLLIVSALFYHGDEVLKTLNTNNPAIKDLESFDKWYFSDKNCLGEIMMESVSEVLDSNCSKNDIKKIFS